jgi:hypothetical protein
MKTKNVEIYTLSEDDKIGIRQKKVLLRDHPTKLFMYEAKWADGTIRVVRKRDIIEMMFEDSSIKPLGG